MNSRIKRIADSLRKIISLLDSEQKRESIFVFIVLLFASVLEMLGVSIVIPYVSALMEPQAFRDKPIFGTILLKLNINTDFGIFLFVSILVVLVYLLKDGLLICSDYVTLKYENKIQKDFSVKMLKSYMLRPYEDAIEKNSAEVLRGISTDVTGLYYIIQAIFAIVSKGLTIILICGVLFATDPMFATVLFCSAGALVYLISRIMKRKVQKSGESFNQQLFENTKDANHAIGAFKEIAVMKRESNFLHFFEESAEKKRIAQLNYRFLQTFPNRVIEFAFIFVLISTLMAKEIIGGNVASTIPQLAAMALASVRILPYVSGMSNSISTIIYYVPSFNNLFENINASKNYVLQNRIWAESEEKLSDEKVFNTISVNNIAWKYRGTQRYIFENLSLEIKSGEAIGIVGGSGAGKTTFADLFLGLLDPQNGDIYIDGISRKSISEKWAHMVGYVPQNVFLLDDSIKNNILFGGDVYDENRIYSVLEKVKLKEFVDELPEGIETVVGERGVKFSGGQRQRIAIARVLYNNPNIIVLDEATSALDSETEQAVMDAVEGLYGEKTLIIIAHRTSTLKKCDRIIKVEGGMATEVKFEECI